MFAMDATAQGLGMCPDLSLPSSNMFFFNFLIWLIGLDFLVVSYLSAVLGLHTATIQKQNVIDHERLQLEPPTSKSDAGISVDFHFTRGTQIPLKGRFRYQKSSMCRKALLLRRVRQNTIQFFVT